MRGVSTSSAHRDGAAVAWLACLALAITSVAVLAFLPEVLAIARIGMPSAAVASY